MYECLISEYDGTYCKTIQDLIDVVGLDTTFFVPYGMWYGFLSYEGDELYEYVGAKWPDKEEYESKRRVTPQSGFGTRIEKAENETVYGRVYRRELVHNMTKVLENCKKTNSSEATITMPVKQLEWLFNRIN